jgi:hypothetical protein
LRISPGSTLIVALIIPPFPPNPNELVDKQYESPPLAPYSSTVICVTPTGTVKSCATKAKVEEKTILPTLEGIDVGDAVGVIVGATVGRLVGETVGDALVGRAVGHTVGGLLGFDGM